MPTYPLASISASPLFGTIPNIHICSECGALIQTESRTRHTHWHERQDQT